MKNESSLKARASRVLDQLGPLLAMLAVWLLFAALSQNNGKNSFVKWDNTQNILLQTAVVGVAALGATMIIISGGIDLSVGSLIALVSVVVALALKQWAVSESNPQGLPTHTAFALAAAVGAAVAALCGLTIGVMVIGRHWLAFGVLAAGAEAFMLWQKGAAIFATWGGRLVFALLAAVAGLSLWADRRFKSRFTLTPFIVTLGLWGALRGVAKGLANNSAIYPSEAGLPKLMALPGAKIDASLLTRPWEWWSPGVWIFLVLAVIVAGVLRYTQFGRHIYAIGSNEQTARLCGVHVERQKLKIYALAGLLAGVAGILQFSFLNAGDPNSAAGYELKVIAAVVIGGASLSGGVGSVMGTVAGALMMTIIDNGCNRLRLENWIQDIITGGIIVAAVALDQLRHRRSE